MVYSPGPRWQKEIACLIQKVKSSVYLIFGQEKKKEKEREYPKKILIKVYSKFQSCKTLCLCHNHSLACTINIF